MAETHQAPHQETDATGTDALFGVPPLPYLRLRVDLAALEPARLPGFKGSTLRGAFGHALRDLACVQEKDTPCGACPLQGGCAYARLFEPSAQAAGPFPQRRGDEVPRPYVFECADRRRQLEAGHHLTFDLLLLGRAVEVQPFVVAALHRLGARGLGPQSKPLRLERIQVQTTQGFVVGYQHQNQAWTRAEPLLPAWNSEAPRDRLRLSFRTPLRLERRGRVLGSLSLFVLAQQILGRARQLAHFHGVPQGVSPALQPLPAAGAISGPPGAAEPLLKGVSGLAGTPGRARGGDSPPDPDLDALFAAVRRVRTASSCLRWADLQRYSQRQGGLQPCGGLVGEMELVGEVGPLLPLLRLAEIIHVGKKAVIGLGQLEVAA